MGNTLSLSLGDRLLVTGPVPLAVSRCHPISSFLCLDILDCWLTSAFLLMKQCFLVDHPDLTMLKLYFPSFILSQSPTPAQSVRSAPSAATSWSNNNPTQWVMLGGILLLDLPHYPMLTSFFEKGPY